MTFVYGFLGGVAGGVATLSVVGWRLQKMVKTTFKLPPLAAKAKP